MYLSVKIAFLKFNCQSSHSSITYLSLSRLPIERDVAYRGTLHYSILLFNRGMDLKNAVASYIQATKEFLSLEEKFKLSVIEGHRIPPDGNDLKRNLGAKPRGRKIGSDNGF